MGDLEARVAELEAANEELRTLVANLAKRLNAHESSSGHSDAPKSIRAAQAAAGTRGSVQNVPAKLAQSAVVNKSTARAKGGGDSYYVGKRRIFINLPEPFKQTDQSDPPAKALKLDWAYGYNGKSARDNLWITEERELIYSLAGTGVVFNIDKGEQRFFTEHNEDIVSLSVHPNRPLVATGQIDPKGSGTPFTCIWDYKSMRLEQRIVFHDRGVCAVGFSPDGKYLLTIGEDDSHTAAIWDWEQNPKKPLATLMVAKDQVYGCEWSPEAKEGTYGFVTFGSKHLKWHSVKIKEGGGIEVSSMIPSSYEQTKVTQKAYHSSTWIKDALVVGGSTGHVYVFNLNQKLAKFFESSKEPINALVPLEEGGYIAVSADGHLRYYDAGHNLVKDVDYGKSKPLSVRRNQGLLAIGCTNCDIYVAPINNPEEKRNFATGFTAEIWALATSPTQPVVAVGADDKKLRLFNYVTKEQISTKSARSGVRSLDFSPDGVHLALGTKDGTIMVYDVQKGDFVYDKRLCKEQVDAIAFAPDGKKLAAGSWDQTIRIVDPFNGKELKVLKGHTSSITHLGFSVDGKLLQTNSRDYEILYWDVESGKRLDFIEPSVEWDRWNCVLGWPVQGVFWNSEDGTDVNCTIVSGGNTNDDENGTKVVATGDDTGHVSVYKWPVLAKKPKVIQYSGHSAHVTNVRFTRADNQKYLFSTGGGDLATFQWLVVENTGSDS